MPGTGSSLALEAGLPVRNPPIETNEAMSQIDPGCLVIWQGSTMRFVVGLARSQSTLFSEVLNDYLGEDNPVRAIDVFVDELRLGDLGFD
jgi:hypothetical protein